MTLTKKNGQQTRGVALIITLMAIVILTLIVGVFLKAYQSHYSLTRSSDSSQIAAAGCESVYDYVRYRLEHQKDWGTQKFTGGSTGDPAGHMLDLEELSGTHSFEGKLEDLGVEFEGTIYTNLAGGADAESAAKARPGTALCQVVCRNGSASRRTEFVLQVAPLFDSSVLSRANLSVNSESLTMRSLDPNRNFLRAEGDIFVPDVLTGRSSRFLQPSGNGADSNGMLWAKGNIHSYGPGGTSPEMINEPGEIADAVSNSNGKVVSQADSHFSIFDLKEDQLKIPDSHDTVNVPAGRWNFVRRPASVTYKATYDKISRWTNKPSTGPWAATSETTNRARAWVDVLEYYAQPEDEVPTKVYRSQHRTEDLEAQIPNEVNTGNGRSGITKWRLSEDTPVETLGVNIEGYSTPVTLQDSGKLVYGEEGKASMVFDLTTQRVTADATAKVKVNGPFHLTSGDDPGIGAAGIDPTSPPTLDLGFDETLSVGSDIAKAAIIAQGTINIETGITEGLGALISRHGDVKIKPQNSGSLQVTSDENNSGLLIYAGGDVVLRNPSKSVDWEFKGLVYAREGIEMSGRGNNAKFEGTIVSLQETERTAGELPRGIEFENCGNIEFIYNGKLLDAFVENLPGQRTQLETIVWKN